MSTALHAHQESPHNEEIESLLERNQSSEPLPQNKPLSLLSRRFWNVLGLVVIIGAFHFIPLPAGYRNSIFTFGFKNSTRHDNDLPFHGFPAGNVRTDSGCSTVGPCNEEPFDEMGRLSMQHDQYRESVDLLKTLRNELGENNFVSMRDHEGRITDPALTFSEIRDVYRSILEDRGLIFVGDSTARLLFGQLWCIANHNYTSDTRMFSLCSQFSQQLKQECRSDHMDRCDILWTPFHDNSTIHLGYLPQFHVNRLASIRTMAPLREAFTSATREGRKPPIVYFGMPCLHELWSPGRREPPAMSVCTELPRRFEQYFDSIHEAVTGESFDSNTTSPEQHKIDTNANNDAVLVLWGLTMTICDKKMGAEMELIRAYLLGRTLGGSKDKFLIDCYNSNPKTKNKLPNDYVGLIPPVKELHRNHTCDGAMFNENGGIRCTIAGLNILLDSKRRRDMLYSASLGKNTSNGMRLKVVDMHGATHGLCNDTVDGRHYMTLGIRRQLTAMSKAIRSFS